MSFCAGVMNQEERAFTWESILTCSLFFWEYTVLSWHSQLYQGIQSFILAFKVLSFTFSQAGPTTCSNQTAQSMLISFLLLIVQSHIVLFPLQYFSLVNAVMNHE